MLEVIKEPNEILRKKSNEIDLDLILSEKIQNLIKDMIVTMYEDDGIGLAAPQVGKNIRLFVVGKEAVKLDKKCGLELKDLILINLVWQKTSRKKVVDTEGCLSVSKTFGKVKRYKNIEVKALDQKGKEIKFKASGFLARVIQHENDHLDGVLFIDKAKDIYQVE